MARTQIRNETHWHELRDACVSNASDVPILDGVGYKSPFQYFHERKGNLPRENLSGNERVVIGRHVEPGIAGAAEELFGIRLAKATAHYTDDAIGGILGATPDYWLDHEDSDTVVEIKNASWGAYKDDWIVHEDGEVECPLRFQLQLQAQLACTGAARGIVIACVSGDRLVKFEQPRHEEGIAHIRAKVLAFKAALDANEEPPAEIVDMKAAAQVWPAGSGTADMRGDAQVEAWLKQIAELRVAEKQVKGEIDRIKSDVQKFCKETGVAAIDANGGRISYKWRDAKPAYMAERAAQPGRSELRITTA